MRPRIVHLTGDFPDPIDSQKTPAIRRLVELTADQFDHQVISINRRSPGLANLPVAAGAALGLCQPLITSQSFDHGVALEYSAPGRGIFHSQFLQGLAKWLASWVHENGKPDLIVAHKLTIEGIAGYAAARRLGVPYAITLQGNTDLKILRARPDLRSVFSNIWQDSSAVFSFAPWTYDAIAERLGKPVGPCFIVPCPLGEEFRPMPPKFGGNQFLSAFHLDNYRDKNFVGLVKAVRSLRAKLPEIQLAIAGSGSDRAKRACKAATSGMPNAFQFLGHLPGETLRQQMNDSVAFVLPSTRESFGLVFIEALYSGLPIIYPAGAAIDGLLDGCEFALRVDARSPRSIAEAIKYAIGHERELKRELADWLQSEDALRFSREAIARGFADGLHAGLAITVPVQAVPATG